jgi:hypothetical protein
MRSAYLLTLALRTGMRLGALALGAGCAATAAAPSVPVPATVVATSDAGAGVARSPALTQEDALATGRTLAAAWLAAKYDDDERAQLMGRHHLDQARVLELLHGIVDACLAEPDRESVACRAVHDDASDAGKACQALTELLGLVADPAATNTTVIRLLVALEARGAPGAGDGLDKLLDRRWEAGLAAREARCKPPTPDELATARLALGDLAIVARAPGATKARWPTSAELDTLAYFYASIANAGPEVGGAKEDSTALPLPDGHPALAARSRLRGELQAARLDGDLEADLRPKSRSRTRPGPRPRRRLPTRWRGWACPSMTRSSFLAPSGWLWSCSTHRSRCRRARCRWC